MKDKSRFTKKILTAIYTLSAVLVAEASAADSQPLVDPTRPNWYGVKSGKKSPPGPVLNSLVNGAQRRIAVINGELMREGETRQGITLEEILIDRVIVTTASGAKKALKLSNFNYPAKSSQGTKR